LDYVNKPRQQNHCPFCHRKTVANLFMHDTITLKEVLERMDSDARFSIAFVTADKHKKKGGEWIEISEAWKGFERTEQQRKNHQRTQYS
jgi:hypothetical protein